MTVTEWNVVLAFFAISGVLAWLGAVGFALACAAYAEVDRTIDPEDWE